MLQSRTPIDNIDLTFLARPILIPAQCASAQVLEAFNKKD